MFGIIAEVSRILITIYRICKWWLEAESNHRHGDFQSPALPTELSSHTKKSADYTLLGLKFGLKSMRNIKK